MSAGDRDTLAEVIVQTIQDQGESYMLTDRGLDSVLIDGHVDMLAVVDVIASSDWFTARVRAAQAQAWEEGHDAVFDHAVDWEGWLNIDGRYTQDALPNPYRSDD